MSIRVTVVLACLLGTFTPWMARATVPGSGAASKLAGVSQRATKTCLDPGGRFALDYPATCIFTSDPWIKIEDPDGPDLFVDVEEIELARAADTIAAHSRLMGQMYEWVNNHHVADGPEGSIHADSIRVARRFRTGHGLPVYEWQCDLISESWPAAPDDGVGADSLARTGQNSVEISVARAPASPVFAVECSRGGHVVIVWIGASAWTVGETETRTMNSIVRSFRLP